MNRIYNVFTRQWLGLDARVWLTFLIGGGIAIGLLSWSLATTTPCLPYAAMASTVKGVQRPSYYVGETIKFTSDAKTSGMVWDFGDHQQAAGAMVEHHFYQPGDYTVTATAGHSCNVQLLVRITPLQAAAPVVTIAIDGPDAPETGEKVEYSLPVTATHYEWSVVNSPNIGLQNKATAVFSFPTPGTRIIELRLDNDPSKVYHKTIDVLPSDIQPVKRSSAIIVPRGKPKAAPAAATAGTTPAAATVTPVVVVPSAETHKPATLTDESLKSKMDQLVAGTLNAKGLEELLCNGTATKIILNGKPKSFEEMCSTLQGKKKIKVKWVITERDVKGCITTMHIEYKKGGWLF